MTRALVGRLAKAVRDRWLACDSATAVALLLLPPAVCYYAFLLTGAGGSGLFAPVTYGLTFNSMLLHLLQGRFDVDPAAIGYEGFVRDGAVYAYFGMFPALFRALFLPLSNFATTDFTRLSCLVADGLMALFKVLSALLVWRKADAPGRTTLLSLVLVVILVSGPQIQFLRPSIYEEILLWADAFAAAFVFLILRGWAREEGFTAATMAALAIIAGLCLLTRVTTALGLYLALGFVLLWHGWQEIRKARISRQSPNLRPLLFPLLILLAFAAATASINKQRWGNPLVFVDLDRTLMRVVNANRSMPLHDYGEFNPVRLGYGLLYYFVPVWVLRDDSGQLLWSGFVRRAIDTVELPPSSFLVSDPLLLGVALYGVVRLVRGNAIPRRAPIVLAAVGLLVPIILMLIAIVMAFRYRMEFYPLFELCAFVGLWLLLTAPSRRFEPVVGGAALASIFAAHFFWLLYMLSPFGSADERMGQSSIVGFYGSLLQRAPQAHDVGQPEQSRF